MNNQNSSDLSLSLLIEGSSGTPTLIVEKKSLEIPTLREKKKKKIDRSYYINLEEKKHSNHPIVLFYHTLRLGFK